MVTAKLNQATMEEKTGRAAVNSFMESREDLADISIVPGGKGFMDVARLFGMAADNKALGFVPNHAGSIRALAAGEIRFVIFEWTSFAAVMASRDKKATDSKIDADQYIQQLRNMDDDAVALPLTEGEGTASHPHRCGWWLNALPTATTFMGLAKTFS